MSSIRILVDGQDMTDAYVALYGGGPLNRIAPGTDLGVVLIGIARNGRPGGAGPALSERQHAELVRLGRTGYGTFVTKSGWEVFVSEEDRPVAHLTIPPEAWRPCANPIEDDDFDERAQLVATLVLNGEAQLHLMAYEVEPGSDPQRTKVGAEDVDSISFAVGAGGPFTTLPIDDREYVVIASPYCQ